MLDQENLLPIPTEENLPDNNEKRMKYELQLLAPLLLRSILLLLWTERMDWFLGVNLGIYAIPDKPAMSPDAFLALGVDYVRSSNELRLCYLIYRENVIPQWILEIVSKQPRDEYGSKFDRYAEMGILYYTIYNPSYYQRDQRDPFEVYRLENGQYVRQTGNPVWMPEISLGIGHEMGTYKQISQDWLYWYDERGIRYPAQEDVLRQEQILRGQRTLMRQNNENNVVTSEQILAQAIALKLIQQGVDLATIAQATGLLTSQLQNLQNSEPLT
jgi:Uma2 family endonuclease